MRIRKNLKLYFNIHEKRFIIFACQEFVKQLQLCELVVARAHSLRFKFQDALSDNGSNGADKDVEHFLSALMEKPEVTVIGAGRGPAGRVIHSLFSKQEVCLFVLFCFFGFITFSSWCGSWYLQRSPKSMFSDLCKSFLFFSLCQNARMQFASDKVESPNELVSISLDAIHP